MKHKLKKWNFTTKVTGTIKIIGLCSAMIMTHTTAYSAVIYSGNSCTSSLSSVGFIATDAKWYKCSPTPTDTSVCGNYYSAAQVTYSSITSGSGTQSSPYVIANCTIVGACVPKTYKDTSTGKCVTCPANTAVIPVSTIPPFHTRTGSASCTVCDKGYYRDMTTSSCVQCPENTDCDGSPQIICKSGYYLTNKTCVSCGTWNDAYTSTSLTTHVSATSAKGATSITGCYIPSGTYYDSTGTFKLTSDCHGHS